MPARLPKVSIIGAGVVGSALTMALFDKGYPIASIISRTGSKALALSKAVKCKRISSQISDIATDSEIILITVSDNAIAYSARKLTAIKKISFKKLFVAHCSGAYSSTVLLPLKKLGTAVASIHPVQTFPHNQSKQKLKTKLRGIYYGIEGDALAVRKAENLVLDIGGKAVVISAELKPLYHIASVFASNYMMAFLNAVSELSEKLQLTASWTEVFGPLMTTSMENSIKHSAAQSLTGPIMRGDYATIDLHLTTLSKLAPHLLPLYTIAGIEVARIAKEHGKLDQKEFQQLVQRFKQFIASLPVKNIKGTK